MVGIGWWGVPVLSLRGDEKKIKGKKVYLCKKIKIKKKKHRTVDNLRYINFSVRQRDIPLFIFYILYHSCLLLFCVLHPLFLTGAEMSAELASLLVDIIFNTLYIYDDHGSRKAVDDVISKALGEVIFMKSFAATLVQFMEKQSKFQSNIGCYRLLKWSCLLLSKSRFASVSKNAFCRVATVQASVLHIVMQGSFRVRRACKRTFFCLFSQVWLNNLFWILRILSLF